MQSNDKPISVLLEEIDEGKIQLPDFQRDWVWNDDKIKALIDSLVRGYPIGAVMFLNYEPEKVKFKYRPIEGVALKEKELVPEQLILDGQQRFTSLYSALYSQKAVKTNRPDRSGHVYMYYYIDIEKSLDLNVYDDDIVFSVPENKKKTSDFGRKVDLDLSTEEKEIENKVFPLNAVFNAVMWSKWSEHYREYYKYDASEVALIDKFIQKILKIQQYQIPVISLEKSTPKQAVCSVFEKVNTGGEPLNVFELVVASYAADDFELRKDWECRRNKYFSNDDLLQCVGEVDFLRALALLSSYKRKNDDDKVVVSCKKPYLLNLPLSEYKKYADILTEGFVKAKNLLLEERVFTKVDLPYSTQLIPLAAICAALREGNQIETANVKDKIKQWYWCGVFGEMYGSANETRYANDIVQVLTWLQDKNRIPDTIQSSYFNPTRLLGLQSRQSAAYKGVIALVLKNQCQDFVSGTEMNLAFYNTEKTDIHHIFPSDWCAKNGMSKEKWNSVVNKSPISARTNRSIGGKAPSEYLHKIESDGKVDSSKLDSYLETHWISPALARADNFDQFVIDRAKRILDAIEKATGKQVPGRDSEEVISRFGDKL